MTHIPQPDPQLQLVHSMYFQAVHDLQQTLPLDDTPEVRAHRIKAAIADIASMLPANADEVTLAARCVSAGAQSADSLRLARRWPDDKALIIRCVAQSNAMIRAANGTRALLLRVQAVRLKREANPATLDKAAWVEHCAVGLMLGALNNTEPPPPEPEPPEPVPVPEPEPEPDASDKFAALSEAEQYAVHYPKRAALIRSLGGLPDNCSFGPPSPELVEAIIAATSPILLELDRQTRPVSP